MSKNRLGLLLALAILLSCAGSAGFAGILAPVESPLVAFYADFSRIDKGAAEVEKSLLFWADKRGRDQAAVSEFIEKTVGAGHFNLQQMYVYYASPSKFGVVFEGEFDVDALGEMIGSKRVSSLENRIVTHVSLGMGGKERLYVELQPGRILACPENYSGNLAANLRAGSNMLGGRFSTFTRLFELGSYALLEASLSEDLKGVLPKELANMEHLRLAISPKIIRLQLSHKDLDEQELEGFMAGLVPFVEALSELTQPRTQLRLEARGSSLFLLSDAPSVDFAQMALYRGYGFFLHLFLAPAVEGCDESLDDGLVSSFAN